MEDVELSIKIHLLKSLNYSFVCCIIQSVKSSSHLSRVLSPELLTLLVEIHNSIIHSISRALIHLSAVTRMLFLGSWDRAVYEILSPF